MPFVAYVDSRPHEPDEGPRPWEPNWRVWRWVGAALLVGFAAGHADGGVQYLLVVTTFTLVCQAVSEALPRMSGLREWRQ